ncbi:MAG: DUF2721 domain-containing protein [Steroidobacterales bacterium]
MTNPDVKAVVDIARLIQVALTPIFLMTAIGVTLNVLTNRLARIVDRARTLEDCLVRSEPSFGGRDVHTQLRVLARRAQFINAAITLIIGSGLLISLVVVMLFVDAFLGWELSAPIAVVFTLSMLSLALSLLAFLIEVRIATTSLRIGMIAAGHQGTKN